MTEMTTITARVPVELIESAKKYEINISKAARKGIELAIEREKRLDEI